MTIDKMTGGGNLFHAIDIYMYSVWICKKSKELTDRFYVYKPTRMQYIRDAVESWKHGMSETSSFNQQYNAEMESSTVHRMKDICMVSSI